MDKMKRNIKKLNINESRKCELKLKIFIFKKKKK